MCHINYQVSFIQSNIGKVADNGRQWMTGQRMGRQWMTGQRIGRQWMTGQRNTVFLIDYTKGQQHPAPPGHIWPVKDICLAHQLNTCTLII